LTAIPKEIYSNIEELRALSMEQRAERISACCRDAAAILAGRRQMGLPDPLPAPWPQSTLDFFRFHAARAAAGLPYLPIYLRTDVGQGDELDREVQA